MKKDPKLQAEAKAQFFEYGRKLGTREVFLDYVWNVVFGASMGYSFSQIHSYSYSIIALQELNLNYFYPRVYWNCACLTIEAMGLKDNEDGSDKAKSTDYGEIAKAIYKMKQSGIQVQPPSINKSKADFTPIEETNSILFGLSGIAGINADIAQQIIDGRQDRPYTNFQDFYNRQTYEGSLLSSSKIVILIKAGCFDEFEPDRTKVMQEYTAMDCPSKQSLTLANLNEIYNMGLQIPKQLRAPYNFRKYVCSSKFFYGQHPNFKSKRLYWLDDTAMRYFEANCRAQLQEGADWFIEDGMTLVVDKSLEKMFQDSTNSLKEYINQPEFIARYNQAKAKAVYDEKVKGNNDPNHWSFEACAFYSHDHELSHINKAKYNVTPFKNLPEEPRFITKRSRNREWRQYEIARIVGTVIARNDNHCTFSLLDIGENVVQVKLDPASFAFYKQQISTVDDNGNRIVVDPSWLKRGVTLAVTGVRTSETDFRVKIYKDSIFQHKIERIVSIDENGDVEFQSYRYGYGDDEA